MEDVKAPKTSNKPLSLFVRVSIILVLVAILFFILFMAWNFMEFRNEKLEHSFARSQDLIRTLRDMRSRHNVPPRQPLEVRIKVAEEHAGDFMDLESLILHLGALSSIAAGPDQTRTIDSAASVTGDLEIYVPGVIDLRILGG